MLKSAEKGFVIILVMALITIFLLTTVTIVSLSCSEIIQVRVNNDFTSAYYVAIAGAERMYARLKDMEAQNLTVTWPLQPLDLQNVPVQAGGSTIGTFTVTAGLTGSSGEFAIVSKGTVNGRTSTVTAKYGYTSPYTNGVPVASIGRMVFAGGSGSGFTSNVYVDGPVESASSITPSQSSAPNTPPYVYFNGDVVPNKTGLSQPSFWYKYDPVTRAWTTKQIYDTNGDGQALADTANKGYVDISDAGGDAAKIAIFNADNINGDNKIDTKDAFISYYTIELNSWGSLGINPGGVNYYSGDKTLDQYNNGVYRSTSMVFVDGDVDIVFNGLKWWGRGQATDFTIISTQDITIVQPVNNPNDRLNLVAYQDIYTGGLNLGYTTATNGNINMYSIRNFTAILGGSTNGSIMAGGTVVVQTGLPSFLFERDINQGTDDWSGLFQKPWGLPPGYPQISRPFFIKAEDFGTQGYKPRWQHR